MDTMFYFHVTYCKLGKTLPGVWYLWELLQYTWKPDQLFCNLRHRWCTRSCWNSTSSQILSAVKFSQSSQIFPALIFHSSQFSPAVKFPWQSNFMFTNRILGSIASASKCEWICNSQQNHSQQQLLWQRWHSRLRCVATQVCTDLGV